MTDLLEFEFTEQAEAIIEEYGLDREEVKAFILKDATQVAGQDLVEFMARKAEGSLNLEEDL